MMAIVGLFLLIQVAGMVIMNLVTVLDWLANIDWLLPIGLRPRVKWGLPGFFVVWLFSLILQVMAMSALKLVPILSIDDYQSVKQLSIVSISNLIFILVIPLLLGPGWRQGCQRLGLMGPELARQVGLGVRVAFLISPWVYMVNMMAKKIFEETPHEVMKMLDRGHGLDKVQGHGVENFSVTMSLAFVGAVILAPMAEEILFRGILLGGLIRKTRSKPASQRQIPVQLANIITSLFFASLHGTAWPAPIGIFVLSLAIGKVYIMTGRLWPCVVAHSVFNFTGVLGMGATALSKKTDVVAWILGMISF